MFIEFRKINSYHVGVRVEMFQLNVYANFCLNVYLHIHLNVHLDIHLKVGQNGKQELLDFWTRLLCPKYFDKEK